MFIQIHDSLQMRQNYPLAIYFFGYHHHQEHVIRMHGLDVYQLFYCESGRGEILTQNKKFLIGKGEVFIISPKTYCEYYSISDKPWIVDIIGFRGSLADAIVNRLNLAQPSIFTLSRNFDFPEFIKNLINITKKPNSQIELSTYCYKLLLLLTNTLTPVLPITENNSDIITEKVIPYIQKNYLKDICLDEIADACKISKGHLCHRFKEEFGQTINNYIISLKITQARQKLIFSPEKSIGEIAIECGFSSASYFGYKFKKIVGMSPNQYRLIN